jgi:hypothetical protein
MDLAALEEIRRLKYRYLRCVDLKLWDEIGDVCAEPEVHREPVGGAADRLNGTSLTHF